MHPIVEDIFDGINPKSIFEVGCSQGRLWKEYYDLRTKKTKEKDADVDPTRLIVGGLDILPYNIQGAHELYPYYKDNFIVWDALNIPYPIPDRSYDLVFTVGTLLMIEADIVPVVKEMLRIGKQVILAEFHDPALDAAGINRDVAGTPVHGPRMYRNYEKVLEQLGRQVKSIEQVHDKWVIRL